MKERLSNGLVQETKEPRYLIDSAVGAGVPSWKDSAWGPFRGSMRSSVLEEFSSIP